MRRIAVVIAVLVAALGGTTLARSTSGPNAKLAQQDRVYGGGTFGPGCFVPDGTLCIDNTRSFSIDAHAAADGSAAYGDIWYGNPGGQDQHAQITCLAVHGAKAVVAGIIDQATRPSILGWWVVFYYDDRGTPARGEPDLASLGFFGPPDPAQQPAGFPYVCPSPDTGAPYSSTPPGYLPLTGGDVAVADAQPAPPSSAVRVVVPRGQAVQIALAEDDTSSASSFTPGVQNAIRMAIDAHPTIDGFPVQVTDTNAPCGDAATDVAAATAIAGNLQIAGVLGQFCSSGFDQALPVYEAAHLVTISGSASSSSLPAFGPTVFDRTIVSDPGSDAWYAAVSQLPSDLAWRQAYTLRFGKPPTGFADLYYDATGILLQGLGSVATIDGGNLLIDRAALASAVRSTTSYAGVTCSVTIDPATGNRVNNLSGC